MSRRRDHALGAIEPFGAALHLDMVRVGAVARISFRLERGDDARVQEAFEGAAGVAFGDGAETEEIILVRRLARDEVLQQVELAQRILDGIRREAALLHGAERGRPDGRGMPVADTQARDAA